MIQSRTTGAVSWELASEKLSRLVVLTMIPVDEFYVDNDRFPGALVFAESCRIFLSGKEVEVVRHRSGAFLLQNYPEGTYELEARAPGFLPFRQEVEISKTRTLTFRTQMIPSVDYPLPSYVPYIKGRMIVDGTEDLPEPVAIEGVKIEANETKNSDPVRNEATFSDENGCFILYFKNFNIDKQTIQIRATHTLYRTQTRTNVLKATDREEISPFKMEPKSG